MIKTVFSSLFAVLLFAMGAVGSWYFVEHQKRLRDDSLTEVGDVSEDLKTTTVTRDSSTVATPTERKDMPIPVHTRSMSAEEVFRIGALQRKSIESLREKEDHLRNEEMRLQLLQRDIEGQRRENEGVLKQMQGTLDAGEKLLAQIVSQRDALSEESAQQKKELEELKSASTVPDDMMQANVKDMAKMLGGMDEAKSAEVLKELVQKGNMSLAMSLLSTMEQRDAAKVLDSLDNPTILVDLLERYRERQRSDLSRTRKR